MKGQMEYISLQISGTQSICTNQTPRIWFGSQLNRPSPELGPLQSMFEPNSIFSQKFINKYFQEVLTGKSFKQCIFKVILQIGLFDQNLVGKKRTLISNLILSIPIDF